MYRSGSGSVRRRLSRVALGIVFCLLVKRVLSQGSQDFELKPFSLENLVHSATSSQFVPPPRTPFTRVADTSRPVSSVRTGRFVQSSSPPQGLADPDPWKLPSSAALRAAAEARTRKAAASNADKTPAIAPFSSADLVLAREAAFAAAVAPTPAPIPDRLTAWQTASPVTRTTTSPFNWTPFSVRVSSFVRTTTPAATSTRPGVCPKGFQPCRCLEPDPDTNASLPSLDCSAAADPLDLMGLRSASGGRPVHFARIIIRGSRLNTLPMAAFGPHFADEYWITDNRGLEKIESGAFGFQADPFKLILFNNNFETFPFQDLKNFQNLEYFVANGNRLKEIPDGAFGIPGGNLVDILLHGNNIRKLGSRAFGHLNRLNAVTLHDNQLEEIKNDALFFTGNPQTLSLRNNQIGKVDKDIFGGSLPRIIDLSKNSIDEFPREPWAFVLHTLADMEAIEPENPTKLILSGNPMSCDCEVLWLYQLREQVEHVLDGLFCVKASIPRPLFQIPRHHFFPKCI